MPKCVSVCRKKILADCKVNPKCLYINGTTRKYCRLSSKYKMSKPSCNVIKRMSKKQAATHIQKLFIKNRTKKRTLKKMDKSASSVVTPRKAYVNKYFVGKEKPITLLGKRDFFKYHLLIQINLKNMYKSQINLG